MILGAFNNIISNSSLSLEEARGQVRDSVDKEFKSKIQKELPTPESINNQLQSYTIETIEDLQKLETRFNVLKNKCRFLKQQVDSKISQLQSIKNKVNKINNNFDKLEQVIEIANKIVPEVQTVISVAPVALAALGGIGSGLAITKLDDGLKAAKGKIAEFKSVLKVLNTIKPFLTGPANDINSKVDSALIALASLKGSTQQTCDYIDALFLQKISQFTPELLDSDTVVDNETSIGLDGSGLRPDGLPIFQLNNQLSNPEEVLNNLENSNKDKFIQYITNVGKPSETGYRIIKR